MTIVLMWIGIAVTLIGWLALAWQASKRLDAKDELEKFPEKRRTMQLRRNYCLLTIGIGIFLLLMALII